jgi:hypothetical protein
MARFRPPQLDREIAIADVGQKVTSDVRFSRD